jgi:excisionase family DNA binding protein
LSPVSQAGPGEVPNTRYALKGREMDKICIVKLRKKMPNPANLQDGRWQEDNAGGAGTAPALSFSVAEKHEAPKAHDHCGAADGKTDAIDRTISLKLTPEQVQSLQANPNLVQFLNGAASTGFEATKDRDGAIVFKFEFESTPPVRLLKVEEVIQMLRISKGYLTKIIRQGELKSYRFGRLRRILLNDVLSYLEGHREFADTRQEESKAKISRNGIG